METLRLSCEALSEEHVILREAPPHSVILSKAKNPDDARTSTGAHPFRYTDATIAQSATLRWELQPAIRNHEPTDPVYYFPLNRSSAGTNSLASDLGLSVR